MSRRRLAPLRLICFARLGGASQNITFELSRATRSEKLQEEEISFHFCRIEDRRYEVKQKRIKRLRYHSEWQKKRRRRRLKK
jgi:hypothetical protein